jgi:hypothetical protein
VCVKQKLAEENISNFKKLDLKTLTDLARNTMKKRKKGRLKGEKSIRFWNQGKLGGLSDLVAGCFLTRPSLPGSGREAELQYEEGVKNGVAVLRR